ncbi:expressed unknown protein [Seminavis robusta]|uniref:Uncharacterized protein n=1 Tax=Seminavis robusta TaxID=568900 RepID=A0A9N8EHM7_9STRA|nr:expressed unknown protein [Seminavis robusta]|eukprot:Sro1148_g246460.1 n/a (633) ;mRNA; f:8011-9979
MAQLQTQLPQGCVGVWVVNENCHKTNRCLFGSVFISYRYKIIGIIHRAVGCNAIVETVYPPLPKGSQQKFWIMPMDHEMYYLEQIGGFSIGLPFMIRPKQYNDDGRLKPLIDVFGFVKLSVKGPDIVQPSFMDTSCFERLIRELQQNKLLLSISRQPKKSQKLQCPVPTLYVYETKEGSMSKVQRPHLYSVQLGVSKGTDIGGKHCRKKFNSIRVAWITKKVADKLLKVWKGEWHCWKKVVHWVVRNSKHIDTYLVPNLAEIGATSGFRIKSVTRAEFAGLKGASFHHGTKLFLLGSEPRDLSHRKCVGRLMSCWGFDKRLTCEQITYPGASIMVDCMHRGIPRPSVGHFGMNAYNNKRFSTAYVATPLEAVEDKGDLQMHRAEFAGHGMRPQLIRMCHALETAALQFAHKMNPEGMNLTKHLSGLNIATCGFRDCKTGQAREGQPPQKRQKIHNNPQSWETRVPYSPRQLVYGFANTGHIDTKDQLTDAQQKELHKNAVDSQVKLRQFPGLPTTCAWQFVFRNTGASQHLKIHQHFTMHGLGVAMPIQHGLGHHFYGGVFEHNTSLCLVECTKDGLVSLSNHDDHFILFAWGNSKKIPRAEILALVQEAAEPLAAAVPAAALPPPPPPPPA